MVPVSTATCQLAFYKPEIVFFIPSTPIGKFFQYIYGALTSPSFIQRETDLHNDPV
jgi:hypothetical protein